MKYLFAVIASLFLCYNIKCQNQTNELAVRKYIQGYNSQDYSKMKKNWTLVGKVLISKKQLRSHFKPLFESHGVAAIDTIISTKYMCLCRLRFEKKPRENFYWAFNFGSEGKIMGAGEDQPFFCYSKANSGIQTKKLQNMADSLISAKYLTGKTPFNGAIMVLKNDSILYQKCAGLQNLNSNIPIDTNTRFDLASCSKQFAAVAITILVREGKIKTTDTITKYMPGLPYPGITIENLLTHTSGIPDYQKLLDEKWDKTKFATNSDIVDILKQNHPPALFPPGTKFRYSNTGYVLLATIIESVSKLKYDEFLNKNIFTPLGMTDTRIYNTRRWKNERISNCADPFIFNKQHQKYEMPDSMSKHSYVICQDPIVGDGSIVTSLSDLRRWQNALIDTVFLSSAEINYLWTPSKVSSHQFQYGKGFCIRQGPNIEKLIYHTGGWPGFKSVILTFPDRKISVVILTNNSYDDFAKIADDLAFLTLY